MECFHTKLKLGSATTALPPSTAHTRALLPKSSNRPSWLASAASSSHPAGRLLSCLPSPALNEKQGVPLGPPDAQVPSVAHDCFYKSSRLFPSLNFKDLFLLRLLLLISPSAHPHLFRPEECDHGGQLLLKLKIIYLHDRDSETDSSFCAVLSSF